MKSFIKRLLAFSIGPFGAAFIGLMTIPVTTHFVSPEEYGKASMFLLALTMLATFQYLGIDQAYTREFHEVNDREALFLNALLLPLLFALFILAMIALNLSTTSQLLFGEPDHDAASLLLGVSLVLLCFERFLLLSLRMQEKALAYSLYTVFIKLIVLAATLVFVLFIRRDFLAVVYSAAVGQIFGDLLILFRLRAMFRLRHFRPNRALLHRMLVFGLPLVVAASASSLLNSAGQLSLRTWSSFYAVGMFAAALKVAAVLSVVQTAFTSFWVPTAYRWHAEGKSIAAFRMVSSGVLLFMSVLYFVVLLFKEPLMCLLSPDYLPAAGLIGLLCLQPVLYTLSETTTLGIVFSRKSYLNLWVSFLSLVPCLLINALAVPKLGTIGAGLATGVSYVLFFIARSWFSAKHWRSFPLYRHYAVIAVLFTAGVLNSMHLPFMVLANLGMLLLVIFMQRRAIVLFYQKFRATKRENDSSTFPS
ncbi:lipopolysaccharide biosynthesis protein [Sporolactobacillus terrae]|uniref:Polysaccharide biosynthesis protein n=1 Tax=Sporolactobacillus terrae TaxID=269673 RepID=A0A410D6K8_9BACL|nr:lipopolysaccharide biosynthesis protein [Sporolactobacillus terrae]QAA21738.1 polysaccharide biosynthesis protein [Sporolactobacillus terrae]QAA24710.1 polysaccharide biosynthesis protein [Sporolactobacillus terrae]UAK16541.1 lipopolysaccharide biosynthesis protein [Sporolactobacillus terrae]BBN98005.1 polysaccharide biosynthesis protein [Sporolactobacillus terrae]